MPEKPIKVSRRKLSDYILDPHNPNAGTERGAYMIGKSIEDHGSARSGVVDKDGVMRAGNHTAEELAAAGIEDVIEVETAGDEWVVVKRADMDEQQGRAYSVADNRASELGLQWDAQELSAMQDTGVVLDTYFNVDELMNFRAQALVQEAPPFDAAKLPDAVRGETQQSYLIYVSFPDEASFRRAVKALTNGERADQRAGIRMAQIDGMAYLESWEQRS